MINPEIIALLVISYLSSFYLIYASIFAIKILQRWDLKSGSDFQIKLEKRTYLIQTIIFWIMFISFIGLFLFIYEIDKLCSFVTGAMCGFGTLSANSYGWITFFLKLAMVLFSGVWLQLNKIDNSFENYPLIKVKSGLLLFITPVFVADSILSTLFFINIKPDIVVSCCGSFFEEFREINEGLTLNLILVRKVFLPIFVIYQAITYWSLIILLNKKKYHYISFINLLNIIVIALYFIFFVSPYIYEMPNHNCSFCMLKIEYHGIGYLYYFLFLFYSMISLSLTFICVIKKFRKDFEFLERHKRKFSFYSISFLTAILCLFIYSVFFSNLRLSY